MAKPIGLPTRFDLRTHLQAGALVGIQAALESALVEELNNHLGFGPYTRSSSGPKPEQMHRSGYFERTVLTSLGTLDQVRIPKLRCGNKDREWQVLTRYLGAMQILLDKALYQNTMGLSIRDLQQALYLFVGDLFSTEAINRITKNVQSTLDDWQNRPIEPTPEILIIDGVWVSILYPTGETFVDKSGHQRQQTRQRERVILVAMVVQPNGNWFVVGYLVSKGETQNGWSQLFEHLRSGGLEAESVKMVVSDGAKGLLTAMERYLPNAHLQRCVVHKVGGFERYLTYEDLPKTDEKTHQPLTREQAKKQRRQQIKNEALAIFLAPTQTEAKNRLSAFVSKWEPIEKRG